jgi:hypothetical protein
MLSRLKFEIDPLVAEILDHLPESVWTSTSTTFFDPAIGGGQFVRAIEQRLRRYGHSDANIRKRVFGFEESNLHIRFAVNKYKLVGQYVRKPYDKFFELDNTMKFDVVIGNPPYQDADDSGGALWSKIVGVCFNNVVKNDGYVAMVHPPSFVGKHQSAGKGKSDYTIFSENQIEEIHLFDDFEKNKYFPGTGTRVCWYIAKKQTPSKDTCIVGYDSGSRYNFNTDFVTTTFLPTNINALTISIHEKLIACSSLVFTQKRELHYHSMKIKQTVNDTQTKEFAYKSYFSHKLIRYSNFKFSDYNAIKLMVPQTSTIDKSFIDNNCNVSEDLFYVVCSSKKEATALQDYLKSNLVSYIGKMYRPGRNLGSLLGSNIIPTPDSVINFTKEELEYIDDISK